METVSFQAIGDAVETQIITRCGDSDTCPGCGAGYRVGLSACEYCRRPVRLSAEGIDKEAIRSRFMRAYSGHASVLTVLHRGEAIIQKAWA